ncbi:MAG: hypothetical protein ABIG32_03550 [Candidatus Uhrbacteria bacterium]|nr:hypothetical protein [Patescibacteria group bacterium]MBU1907399.1 hypothetical protein [Patescibacteria group bacterium]
MNKKDAAFWFGLAFALVGGGMDAFFLIKYFAGTLAMEPGAEIPTLVLGLVVGTTALAAGIYAIVYSRQKKDSNP